CLLPIIVYSIRKKTLSAEQIFLFFTLTALSLFLFFPRMHERYVYPVFPLLAVYTGLTKKYFIIYLLLSLCNLINLYVVWHPMTLSFFPYHLMNNATFQWTVSFCTVLTGIIFYGQALKGLYEK